MVREVPQIEKDVVALEQEVVALAQELSETYEEYLNVLGEVTQRQLILASYYLCTQCYPGRFLSLSFKQRQQVQEKLKAIAKQACTELTHPPQLEQLPQPFSHELDGPDRSAEAMEEAKARSLSALVRRLLSQNKKSSMDDEDEDSTAFDLAIDDEALNAEISDDFETIVVPDDVTVEFMPDVQLEISELDFDASSEAGEKDSDSSLEQEHPSQEGKPVSSESDALSERETSSDSGLDLSTTSLIEATMESLAETHTADVEDADNSALPPIRPTPLALANRRDRLEDQINQVLKQATEQANRVLQESGVLMKKLPDAVLEAALKADLSTDIPGNHPNILQLIVETSGKGEPQLSRIMAVRLRLAELEFNNPTLTAWRSRIRELSAHLQSFEKKHHKLRQEQSIAEAEAAWRSSWYEDHD